MGIWDGVYDSVNQYAIKPTKWVCWSAYSYGRAAATGSDKAVRNMIQRAQLHDPDTAGSIAANCAKNAAFFALREGAKTFPGGGPVYDIVTRSFKDGSKKPPNDHSRKNGMMVEELHAQVTDYKVKTAQLQSLVEDYKEKTIQLQASVSKLMEEKKELRLENMEAETHVTGLLHMEPANLGPKEQKQEDARSLINACWFLGKQPEDSIRTFVMQELMGAHVWDDLKPREC